MKRKVALELYAEEITNCQVGDELTSIIFDKTNLITKSFFILKNNRKCVKFSSILNNTFIKLTFRFLIHSDQSNLKRLFFVSKFLERKNKFTCFKIFQILK